MFTNKSGQPVVPNTDYHALRGSSARAGVREARLHDARHTEATALEVPERTVMGITAWSTTGMVARYQHVTDPIRQEVAARVGELLWADQVSN